MIIILFFFFLLSIVPKYGDKSVFTKTEDIDDKNDTKIIDTQSNIIGAMPHLIVERKKNKKRRKIDSTQLLKRLSYKSLKFLDIAEEQNQSGLISYPGNYVKFPDNLYEVV